MTDNTAKNLDTNEDQPDNWLFNVTDEQLDDLSKLADLPESPVIARIEDYDTVPIPNNTLANGSSEFDTTTSEQNYRLPASLTQTENHTARRTMVLHTRVIAGTGGGPEKTILRSPKHADNTYLNMAVAYIHPKGDSGIDVLKQRAAEQDCPFYTIAEKGAFDLRTLRSLYLLCKKLNVTVWHAHDYKSNLFGLLIRRFWKMKLVTTVHGWTNDTWRTRLYYHVDKFCLPKYDEVISVSPLLTQQCKDIGVPEDRLTYIANGIETKVFRRTQATKQARIDMGVDQKALTIGVVSRLSSEKGVDRAVRVAAQLHKNYPNLELHLVGDGPEYDNLKQLAKDHGIESAMKFWGWQADARNIYETMNMLLLPSHTEGFPNVVLEAMAMGIPVAATNVGAVSELLKNGRRGVILDNHDETTWADQVEPLLVSAQRRNELARKGRQRINKYYSFDTRMEKVFAIYDRVLSIKPKEENNTWRRAA